MPTINENLAGIRQLLSEPDDDSPKQHIIYEHLFNQIQHHLAQLNNTQAAWTVNSFTLQLTQGTEDYLITATDFGKPFWCYTINPQDRYFWRREIPFYQLQNLDLAYRGPQLSSYVGPPSDAAAIAFYRVGQSAYARVAPIPGGASQIVIWYETVLLQAQALGDAPGLTPFHHLVRVQTALSVLADCNWGTVRYDNENAKAWERRVKMKESALLRDEAKFQAEFSRYIGTLVEGGIHSRDGFGQDGMWDASGYATGSFAW